MLSSEVLMDRNQKILEIQQRTREILKVVSESENVQILESGWPTPEDEILDLLACIGVCSKYLIFDLEATRRERGGAH